jgi:hypothetical protein
MRIGVRRTRRIPYQSLRVEVLDDQPCHRRERRLSQNVIAERLHVSGQSTQVRVQTSGRYGGLSLGQSKAHFGWAVAGARVQ